MPSGVRGHLGVSVQADVSRKMEYCPQSPDSEHAMTKEMEAKVALLSSKRHTQTMSQPSKRNHTASTHLIVLKTQSGAGGLSGLPAQLPAITRLNPSR